MSPDGIHTAVLLKFLNELFDSLNGGINMNNRSMNLNTMTSVTNNSHVNTWNSGIQFFKNVQFIKKKPELYMDRGMPKIVSGSETYALHTTNFSNI